MQVYDIMMKKIIIIIFIILISTNAVLAVEKWQNPKSIKTYIPQNHANSLMMRHAFEEWTRLTNDKIIFVFVKSKDSSQIDVEFVKQIENQSDKAIGLTRRKFYPNRLVHATVYIADKTQQGKSLNRDEIYTTMLHEIGHAIGLDHTNDKKSVMYPGVNVIQEIQKADLDTINALYKF